MPTLSRRAAAFLKLPDGTTPFLEPCWAGERGLYQHPASCFCQGTGTVVRATVTEGEVEQVLVAMGYVYQAGFRMVDGYWFHIWRTNEDRPYVSLESRSDTPMGALNAAIEQAAGEAG